MPAQRQRQRPDLAPTRTPGGASAAPACEAMGPDPVSLTTSSAVGGEHELVLEEADYTLSLRVSTDPFTGGTAQRLLFWDADGTFISGVSTEPVEYMGDAGGPVEFASSEAEDPGWWAALDDEHHLLERGAGVLQGIGGIGQITGGLGLLLAPEPTMLSKVGGAALALHGLDDLIAGARTAWDGAAAKTATESLGVAGAGAVGLDERLAGWVGMGLDMVAGGLSPGSWGRAGAREGLERVALEGAERGAKTVGRAESQLTAAGRHVPAALSPPDLARVLQ